MPDFNTPPNPDGRDARGLGQDSLSPALEAHGAPERDEEMLRRQAETLDAMFHMTVSHSFGTQHFHREDKPHYMDDTRIALALRIQHQCCATLKAKSAVSYMGALSYTVTPNAFRPLQESSTEAPPTPLQDDEQKEGP